jgi:hypothetical protein
MGTIATSWALPVMRMVKNATSRAIPVMREVKIATSQALIVMRRRFTAVDAAHLFCHASSRSFAHPIRLPLEDGASRSLDRDPLSGPHAWHDPRSTRARRWYESKQPAPAPLRP